MRLLRLQNWKSLWICTENYSSGMQVRLAFSIAIMADADIYVLDEVLAVGDTAFQKKCFDIFRSYREQEKL